MDLWDTDLRRDVSSLQGGVGPRLFQDGNLQVVALPVPGPEQRLLTDVFPVFVTHVLPSCQWMATVAYLERNGLPALMWIRVFPGAPNSIVSVSEHPALTVRDTRELQTDLLPKVRELLAGREDDPVLAFLFKGTRTPGAGRTITDDDHALLAAVYISTLQEHPSRPWLHLAKVSEVDKDTLRGWRADAVRAEFLTRAEPGKSGGQLTDKAILQLRRLRIDEPEKAVTKWLQTDRVHRGKLAAKRPEKGLTGIGGAGHTTIGGTHQ